MDLDRFQAPRPRPTSFDDRPPLEIGPDHPWALDDDRPPERVVNLDTGRSVSMDEVWAAHRNAQARAEERIGSALTAYDEPSTVEQPEASPGVLTFLEELEDYGSTDPRLLRLLKLPRTATFVEDEIVPLISAGALPKRLVAAHVRILSGLSLMDQVALLTDSYQLSALRVLKNGKERASEEERFIAAEYFFAAHPTLIRKFRETGFTPIEIDAFVTRMAAREPGKAYLMRENLDDPYSRDELYGLLEDTYWRLDQDGDGAEFDRQAADVVRLARLSKKEVEMFLRAKGLYSRDRLLRLFGVPNTEGTLHWSEAGPLLRGRDDVEKIDEVREQELERFMEGAEKIDGALYDALLQAFPERVEKIESDRSQVEALRSAAVERIGVFEKGTNSAPLRLLLEDVEMPVVYKTPQREPRTQGDSLTTEEAREAARAKDIDFDLIVRVGVLPGEGFKREWLCRVVSEAFQTELVTPTVIRRGPEGVGSMQAWRIGSPAATVEWEERLGEERLIWLAVFDYLVQHCDRHLANFLLTPEDEAVAIDNALSFSLATGPDAPKRDQLRSFPARHMAGREIPLIIRRQLRRAIQNPGVIAALRQSFDLVFPGHANKMFTQFLQRVEHVAPRDERTPSYVPNAVWTISNELE